MSKKARAELRKLSSENGGQAVNHPVRGQDAQSGAVHVDESHHDELVGKCAGSGVSVGRIGGAAFVAVGEGGFVAVVAVGDDEFLVVHGGADGIDQKRIGDLPDAVNDAVFIFYRDIRDCSGGSGEKGFDPSGILIEHENLAEVGAGGAQQIEAVGLGFGQGLLVAEDDAGGIVFDATESDEAVALEFGS